MDEYEEIEDESRSLNLPILGTLIFVIAAVSGLWLLYRDKSRPEKSEIHRAQAPSVENDTQSKTIHLDFSELGVERGIKFRHENGGRGQKLLPETMGSGAAFLDFDGDGDQDLMLVNSCSWDEGGADTKATQAFFMNQNGFFTDVTKEVGLDISFYGMGVAVGDYDGDGDPDLFVTAVGRNHLLRNENGRRFVDVSLEAGVAGDESWSTGAVFFDHDRDGDLDLFVLNYVSWSPEIDLKLGFSLGSLDRAFGPPTAFKGAQPFFYENLGGGKFRECAKQLGLHVENKATKVPVGKSLALVVADFNNDSWPDIAVANDTVRNFVFQNRGDGTFEELGIGLGLAFDENGNARGAMGMDVGHFRNDDSLALAIGNFANEMTAFYVNDDLENPLFIDEATSVGIGAPSRDSLSFGLLFVDCDLDGYLDLAVANGHVEPEIARVQESQSHAQQFDVFRNEGGRFRRVECRAFMGRFVGRGLAKADIDGDGDIDLLATSNGGRPRLFVNNQVGGRSIRLDLRLADGKRVAVGARVFLDSELGVQCQTLRAGGSYLSSNELVVTFGLGAREKAKNVRVVWPDGQVQVIQELRAGSHTFVQEP